MKADGTSRLKGRRAVLGGLGGVAALAAAPALAPATGAPEVVVIGAGLAGLAAARRLGARGVRTVVVEARDRIGGRAVTDTATFGVPFDLGCAWLHSADRNPFTTVVRDRLGFAVHDDSDPDLWLYLDGDEADDDGYDALDDALARLLRRIDGWEDDDRPDLSVARLSPPRDRFARISHTLVGPLEAGVETDRLSVADVVAQIGTGTEWLVPAGLGAAVAAFGAGVPVRTGTVVQEVIWGARTGGDLAVVTGRGTLRCAAVVVTVPAGVLAEGRIKFTPELPGWKRAAVEGLPMGLLDKIALGFDADLFDGEAATTSCLIQAGPDAPLWDFLLQPFGYDMAVAFVGGDPARELTAGSDADAAAAALDALVGAFGADVRRHVVATRFTRWGDDPFARGAYAAVEVGGHDARRALARPIDDRLFFAGEATVPEWATQVAAAYLSGLRAGDRAADAVG